MTGAHKEPAAGEQALTDRVTGYTSVADLVRGVMAQSTVLSREHMEQAARTYLVTYLNADLETRAALFAEDATFEDPVGAQPLRGIKAIVEFWQGAKDIRWWAAHDVRRIVVSGNEVMLHFVSTMRVPGLTTARMEVYEVQAFNAAGKICSVKAYFDSDCLLG
ncbi:MAG: nuclear transport factor 2 family protein [Proteobacteria bacterium]|nr:nuclear transport factor 2 family protein [Pseudomonadota bacterium]